MKYFLAFLMIVFGNTLLVQAQSATISGKVTSNDEAVPYANLYLPALKKGTAAQSDGSFLLKNIEPGTYKIRVQAIGYMTEEINIDLKPGENLDLDFEIKDDILGLDEVVVSGTRTDKRRTDNAIAVNILDPETMNITQSNTISEGLCFQPGLRTEVNCQTCNYTQLRINGLGGSYSQILINSRPVFSPLIGLYGLEQLPASMIEQIEVVRGGGSALYGSSAIGGTVNIITRTPVKSSYQVSFNQELIRGNTSDNLVNAHVTTVSEDQKAGLTLFASRRNRNGFDANGDGYTELSEITGTTAGLNSFFKLSEKSKLEISAFSIQEDRRGGNDLEQAAHLADQSEDRDHKINIATIDFRHEFNDLTNLNLYIAGQDTRRKHFTGITPDIEFDAVNQRLDSSAWEEYRLNPPYGLTTNQTLMSGFQLNQKVTNFLGGVNNFTIGAEYQYDDIRDEIEAYDYLIDQTTRQWGFFVQSDWEINDKLIFLSGARLNTHNLVDQLVVNPRLSLMYKFAPRFQLRTSYASGFRAPQAFDADLHIAFAGGGISVVQIDPDLEEELSHSLSASLDYDKATEDWIYGFTLEGFHTRLFNTFVLEEKSTDSDGNMIIQKTNGSSSTVEGLTLELRGNFKGMLQLESGITWQKSLFAAPVEWSADIPGIREYLRTPETYGYYTLAFMPDDRWNVSWSGVLTGAMNVPHFGGAPGVDGDRMVVSPVFRSDNVRASFSSNWGSVKLNFFGGVKNVFDQYQDDFDIGKNRDSNFVYGPALPRSYFFGIRIGG